MKKALFVLLMIFLMGMASASDAIIAYRSDSGGTACPGPDLYCPKIKFWDSDADGEWGSEIVLNSTNSEVKWAIVKSSPVSSKIVLVTQSSGGSTNYDKLTGYVCMADCDNAANWVVTTNLATVSNTGGGGGSEIQERMFDVEFETATGDAIVVYSVDDDEDDEKDFGYKILPAATSSFASLIEYYIDDESDGSDDVEHKWVRLDRDPVPGSEELIMTAYNPEEHDIDAWVWNGSAWGSQAGISDDADNTGGYEALAVRYDAQGEKAMVLGAYGSKGKVNYRYWNGALWSSTNYFDVDTSGYWCGYHTWCTDEYDVRWINLKADPDSNDLQAVFVDNGEDLHTAYWSGSSWTVESNIDESLDSGTTRPADFEWESEGSTGILVWDTDGVNTGLKQTVCSPQCSGATSTKYSYSGSGRWITLYSNPTEEDEVRILGARLKYSSGYKGIGLGSFSFNGSSYNNYGNYEITDDTTTTYESYSIAFISMDVANISVIKINQTAAQPSAGGIAEFNITVTNTGTMALDPVEVLDILPSGLTFSSASPAATQNGQNLSWSIGPLGAGNSVTIMVNATVDEGVADAETPVVDLTNYVNVTGVPSSGDNVTAEDSEDVTVYYAGISIIKVDATPVLTSPGGVVEWYINISNPGELELDPVFVSDTLPENFSYKNGYPEPDSEADRMVNWTNVGPLAPGSYITLLLNSSVDSGAANGTYTNYIVVTGTPPNGDDVSDDSTAQVGIYAPAINVIKSTNDSIKTYTHVNKTFVLSITNTGSVSINVTVEDVLPENISFEGSPVAATVNGQVVTWENFVELPVGGSALLEYNLSANRTGTYTNNVTVTGTPPNGDNVTDDDSATFIIYKRPDGDGEPSKKDLDVDVELSCDGNLVTVTSKGEPLKDARVAVIQVDLETDWIGGTVTIGYTDSEGKYEFESCGMEVKIHVSKPNYYSEDVYTVLVDCEECEGPSCTENTDCPTEQYCDDGECVPVSCICGVVVGHECAEYQCCSDDDCPEGGSCIDNSCQFECYSDEDCIDTDYCKIEEAAAGGECEPVTGECGYAQDHAWIQYGCGDEPGCPECTEGLCIDHQCIEGTVDCPPGIVEDESDCTATENGGPCADCEYRITDPAGKTIVGNTDEDGKFNFQFESEGNYTVYLLMNGEVIATATVESFARPALELHPQAGVVNFDLLWLLLLLLLIAALILYYWKHSKKKPEKPAPPQKK